MTRPVLLASILVCTSVLTATLGFNGYLIHAMVIALIGIAWLVLHSLNKMPLDWLAFLLFSLASLILTWLDVSHWLVLTCILTALLAWDLTAFETKLQGIPPEDTHPMESAHFTRLALVFGVGLAGIVASGFIQVTITFGLALILALLSLWGVSTLVYRLRNRG
ncbi:MAG: hypothetical protein H6635_08955 [Anaerolineales bacterium]|nr:hypothetical protein [Anaerolineales bacterium]MCB9145486.1 hypothetical protein [Anaerolineales bacterium]